jgi:chitinase
MLRTLKGKKMRFRVVFLLACLLLLAAAPLAAQDDPNYRIVGYYTSWAMYGRQYFVDEIPADLLTHINYAFANINRDDECNLGDEWSDTQFLYPGDTEDMELRGNFRQLNLLKEAHPHLQTLISVGGWTWSTRFSDVASTPERRQHFASSCVDFMLRYGFDGIDLDWEYPAGGGNPGNRTRPEDPENFILLLQEFRDQLDARGAQDGRTYLLTIATSAGRSQYQPLDWARIHPLLDWINVMAYDMSGGWSTVTGFNAPLYESTENPPEVTSVDTAIQDYLAFGIPSDKLVLGVPFYGYGWSDVPNVNHGLHQQYEGRPNGTWDVGAFEYNDLAANYVGVYERYWDETAQVPWLYYPDEGIMITYDDPESLTAKAQYAVDNGLGGIMFWELSQDTTDSELLTAINDVLNVP